MEPNIDEQLRQLYESIEAANSEGLIEEAMKKCQTALDLLEEHGDEVEAYSYADFLMLAGDTSWAAGDLEEAQRYYRRSSELEPDRLDSAVAVGVTLFHLCRFEAARAQLETVSAEDTEIGEVWYYLALLALRRSDLALADNFFRRAHELEPDRWLIPVEMHHEKMIDLVEGFYADMPPEIRKALENVPIVIEERPSEALLFSSDPPLDPLLLGLFDGTPMPEESVFSAQTKPTQIHLFAENIRLIAGDREELEEELWITLKHEIGHFFGLDEDDLDARGLS